MEEAAAAYNRASFRMRGARAILNFPPEVQVSQHDGGGSAIRVDFKKEDATGPGPLGRTQTPSDGFCDGVELPQRRSDCVYMERIGGRGSFGGGRGAGTNGRFGGTAVVVEEQEPWQIWGDGGAGGASGVDDIYVQILV
ncbi:hypothetical protein Taro_038844 [Colocasia esculenta]|uniref:AP2/ERF domain-containing protein n=1 Tax=Colocasia esculenta TaxID=4460 RepID=A0A843WF01_COLES|nr:hypothetical protein [Colocasia esculenta]